MKINFTVHANLTSMFLKVDLTEFILEEMSQLMDEGVFFDDFVSDLSDELAEGFEEIGYIEASDLAPYVEVLCNPSDVVVTEVSLEDDWVGYNVPISFDIERFVKEKTAK